MITVNDEPAPGFETSIEADLIDGKLIAKSVTVRSLVDGVPVTGTELRAVRVKAIIIENAPYLGAVLQVPADIEGLRKAGMRNLETACAVADLYRLAEYTGHPPVKCVQEQFGLSRPTATRWIRHAREIGVLPCGS